jgi:ribonuclease III
MKKNAELSQLEERLGVVFANKEILEEALTHRSYLNEHRGVKRAHNERLEFLGDAVLELAITEELFKKYPEEQEGMLTAYRSALVNTQSLSEVAGDLGIDEFLMLSKGESKETGRARLVIHANAVEAVIGAVHLDQGYAAAKKFISAYVLSRLDEVVKKRLWQDAKSRFQEGAQEHESTTPSYKTLDEVGPDHDKKFTVGVFIGDELIAKGEGKAKQEAEQSAAEAALQKKGW